MYDNRKCTDEFGSRWKIPRIDPFTVSATTNFFVHFFGISTTEKYYFNRMNSSSSNGNSSNSDASYVTRESISSTIRASEAESELLVHKN